jgi:hypothetical protein
MNSKMGGLLGNARLSKRIGNDTHCFPGFAAYDNLSGMAANPSRYRGTIDMRLSDD